MTVWPASLPQDVLVDAYNEAFADNLVEIPVANGPPKRRRRFTKAPPRDFTVLIEIDRTQAATLDTFFHTTLKDGLDSFTFPHPRTQATVSMQFQVGKPPALKFLPGAQLLRTPLHLEVL